MTFGLEGVNYEIDLNDAHAEGLRAAIKQYASAGRRVGGAGRRASAAAVNNSSGYDPKAVRAWAASNRVELPARGRIPAAVLEQYRAAIAAAQMTRGEALQAAEENLQLATEAYQAGKIDFLQLLVVRRAALEERRAAIEAAEDLHNARAQLDRALGRTK